MSTEREVHVVDPEQQMSRPLAGLLATYGIRVRRHASVEAFRERFQVEPGAHGCLLLELDVKSKRDLDALRSLHTSYPSLAIVVMADDIGDNAPREAREAGATDLIERSLVSAYLFNRLSMLLPGVDNLPHTQTEVIQSAAGEQITFRMIHPEDADIEQAFVAGLSEKSKYMRFFSGLKQLPAHVLKEFTTPEFPLSYAVLAIVKKPSGDKQIGVARWAPTGADGVAEFAVVVADDYQGQGIGSRLMRLLIAAATVGGLQRLEGLILNENKSMLAMMRKMGFKPCREHDAGPTVSLYVKTLRGEGA